MQQGSDHPIREPESLLAHALKQWGGQRDLWVFGYASLIWRPDFEFEERRVAHVHGWHRALKMWSRVYRGTPQCPGLVFALLSGGSCHGVVFRIARTRGHAVLQTLWEREMISAVYDPRWIACNTPQGRVQALAFTLSRRSQSFTGELEPQRLSEIFRRSQGRYGSTLDYVQQTHEGLCREGLEDRRIRDLLRLATEGHIGRKPGRG